MCRVSFVVVMLFALMPALPLFAQGGELLVRSPMLGETVIGDTVAVYLDTPGIQIIPSPVKLEEAGKHPEANRSGEGHLHLMLDLQPMVVWGSSEAYVFENVPPGDHVLTIEIVENDHSSFTPPLLEQIRFTSVAAPASTEIVAMLPNTGFESVAARPSTMVLVALGCLLMVTGLRLRLEYV